MNATVWLFNNKVFITLGGDVNYGSESSANNNKFSQGNVDIGYVVNKDKSLKLKLSYKTDFNELQSVWENKGGIGINYGKDFGKFIKNN
ncbi:MAG: hypothetical protein R2771_15135 [Saprospiraceae bacterium]